MGASYSTAANADNSLDIEIINIKKRELIQKREEAVVEKEVDTKREEIWEKTRNTRQ